MDRPKTIFISALEASAELHCANLISAYRQRGFDNIRFVGFGGAKMEAAGCEILENTVSKAAMIYNVLGQIGYYKSLIARAKSFMTENHVDQVIVCDSPAFNFHIAKAAQKQAIRTLFYVAPQLWAWAPWRIRKLRRCCDRLACILPFEEQWFNSRNMPCRFVGNPLLDELDTNIPATYRNYDSYSTDTATIALLPGSRDAEIDSLWIPMQQIALKLKAEHPNLKFVAVASDESKLEKLKSMQKSGLGCSYEIHSVYETCGRCDLTLVASGSATLQVAAAGCPMIVMYQSNRFLWHLIGKWLINIKKLSLVNILSQKELVPEFMPYFTSVEPICQAAKNLIENPEKLAEINRSLVDLICSMTRQNAAENVADMSLDLLRS